MDIGRLVAEVAITPNERRELECLLELKTRSSELGMGDALPAIDNLIESELALGSAAALATPHEAAGQEALAAAHDLMIAASRFADRSLPAADVTPGGRGSARFWP
jgi:hypothetical protein